jgi:hypothetical protein
MERGYYERTVAAFHLLLFTPLHRYRRGKHFGIWVSVQVSRNFNYIFPKKRCSKEFSTSEAKKEMKFR